MQCKHCGSPLKIEQERCPFCGQPNPDFHQHRQDMEQYSQHFEKTRSHVYRETHKFTRMTVPLTVITILIFANILVFFLISQSWNISSWFLERQIVKEADFHRAQLEQMLAAEDYLGFHGYFTYNDLYIADEFDGYQALDNAASSFDSLFGNVANYLSGESYMEAEELAKSISFNLGYLYEAEETFGTYSFRQDDPAHLELIHDMIERAHLLIASCFDLPLEAVETFPDLSESKRQEMILGGMADE